MNNRIPVPPEWQLVGQGVLARNKNNSSLRYFGELFNTPNGFLHIISIYRMEGNDLFRAGCKAHLLKPDSTVLYEDSDVQYALVGNPEDALRMHEGL